MEMDGLHDTIVDGSFTAKDAEKGILHRALTGAAEDVVNAMRASDFSDPLYAMIFEAMQGVLAKRGHVDTITVDAELSARHSDMMPQLAPALVELMSFRAVTAASQRSLEDYIRIVRGLAARRQAIGMMEKLAADLHDPEKDVNETLSEIEDAAYGIETGAAQWMGISEVLLNTYTWLERRQKGEVKCITTGIGSLDRLIGGFYAGELTVIGARPSVGKSAFGANIALEAAKQGFRVGIVSCEMVDIGFGQRLLSRGGNVDGMAIRKGEIDDGAWQRLAEGMELLGNLPIEFLFDSNYVEDVVKTATQKARKGKMDLLIVDYLQIMETRKNFREDRLRVGYISKMLKNLALRAQIPVIALAQVNRESAGQMPTLKSLKDSGSIEQDCDGVFFIHRPEDANDPFVDPRDKEHFDKFAENKMVYLCVAVAKQRQGAIGQASVIFEPGIMRYTEIDRRCQGCQCK